MANLPSSIPSEFQEKYLLKRIDEDDITLTLEQRDAIIKALLGNARFIQIGKYTIMVNAIKSIDPLWGAKNIPPRPAEEWTTEFSNAANTVAKKIVNQNKLDLWDKLFADKK